MVVLIMNRADIRLELYSPADFVDSVTVLSVSFVEQCRSGLFFFTSQLCLWVDNQIQNYLTLITQRICIFLFYQDGQVYSLDKPVGWGLYLFPI
jgi:hypothetical protein